jgi:hypothetical protein
MNSEKEEIANQSEELQKNISHIRNKIANITNNVGNYGDKMSDPELRGKLKGKVKLLLAQSVEILDILEPELDQFTEKMVDIADRQIPKLVRSGFSVVKDGMESVPGVGLVFLVLDGISTFVTLGSTLARTANTVLSSGLDVREKINNSMNRIENVNNQFRGGVTTKNNKRKKRNTKKIKED